MESTNVLPDGAVRGRADPYRFAESEYSTFSEYELRRLEVRHDCVSDKDIEEARSTEPALSEELEVLFARLRAAASDTTGSDPASELVGNMERAAAVTLHAALLECLQASGTHEETPHVWADGCAPAIGVPACMPEHGTPTDERHWGQLLIAPPLQYIAPPLQERLIHVSSLIRLGGLLFAPGPGGPARRQMRSGVTKLHYLSRDVHHSILACCFE